MSVATTSVIVAIIGIGLATYMYAPKKTPLADGLAKKMPKLHKAALNRFYIDHPWQSGDVRSYAIWFLTGTVALTLCLLALL